MRRARICILDISPGEMVFPTASYSADPEYTVRAAPEASERYPGYVWVQVTMPDGTQTTKKIKDTTMVITEIA